MPHGATLKLLLREGYDISPFFPKRWTAFVQDRAPRMDFIFLLGDVRHATARPKWPGDP